ncbi:MAG TPA: O-antigen ligase family protein [Verrucomicrobiae bacterium]|nr:O-antigen ligase family protein [Verrucomicrobiae bacterium]
MNHETWDKFFERGILALVLAILVFGPLAMGAVDAWAFLVIQGLIIGVMVLWALRLWINPKPKFLWPPICWVVLIFTLYAIGRYLTADIEYVARQEMIQVLVCAFLFFAIVNNLYRQEYSQIISFTMVALGTGIASYAIFQFLKHSNHVWNYVSPYYGRASGTYISPNNLAGFLEMLLPLSVAYLLVGRIKPVTRILAGCAALIMLLGIAATFSRGGWISVTLALLALLIILVCQRNHRLPALLLLIAFVGVGFYCAQKFLTRSVYFYRVENAGGDFDFQVRKEMWQAAAQMWRDHVWWGVGPAHYDYRFSEYRPQALQMRPDRVHNDYLNLLVDWGVVGGVIVLAGMAAFAIGLLQTRKSMRRSENDFGDGKSNRHAFFLGAFAGLLALAAHSVVDFNLHIPANAILGVALLALLSSNLRFATEHYWVNLIAPVKMLATLALVTGIFYLSCQEWRRGHEEFLLTQAKRLPDFSPERTTVLKKAFAVEPNNFETAYNIGEAYRLQSFAGDENYETSAQTAMQWYERGWKLDRYASDDYLRYAMCLDWLERHDEAEKYYDLADALDPNSYYTAANIGWHYVQTGDYAAARSWLRRSKRLHWPDNDIARNYLDLVEKRLVENASGGGG